MILGDLEGKIIFNIIVNGIEVIQLIEKLTLPPNGLFLEGKNIEFQSL